MKLLFMKSGGRRLFEPPLHPMTLISGLIVIMVLLNGCASTPYVDNIKSRSDLKADEKVLAGRFACFENDAPVHCTKSGFLIYFNRDGDLEAKLLSPDDAGYVYVAVREGVYYFGRFVKGGKDESFIFNPDRFPAVLVPLDDSVVNFATFEVRFYLSPESKGSTAQIGAKAAEFRINHIANYDVTRSEIASRVGKLGSISDGSVQFRERARN